VGSVIVCILDRGELSDLLEEAGDVCGDILECYFGVFVEGDVAVMPAELRIVVGVVVA
jgi:hypothetical protein